jgi:hypothetical protein
MKVLISSVIDDELNVATTATAEVVDGRVVLTGSPAEQAWLRSYRTFDPDGVDHGIDEGEIWLRNLPRSMAFGTYYGAMFAESDASTDHDGCRRERRKTGTQGGHTR